MASSTFAMGADGAFLVGVMPFAQGDWKWRIDRGDPSDVTP
jgi:hypothetical protein